MRDLPEDWIEATVRDLTENINYGHTASATNNPIGPKFLRITDIQNGNVDWQSVPYCAALIGETNGYSLDVGDIVFARTGATTGKSYLIRECPTGAVFASYLIRVRPHSALSPSYVAHFFHSANYWAQITENIAGSAQPNCNASKLATISVPLAPEGEQHRIVAKLDALLSRVNACRQRLDKIPKLLARFRQSVLVAACSGRLTEDWRDEIIEQVSAKELLQKIHRERESSARQSKKAPLEPCNVDDFGQEIPRSWILSTIDQLATNVVDGVHKKPDYVESGIPFLTVRNLTAGTGISFASYKSISAADHVLFTKRAKPEKGDILVTKDGTLGIVRLIETEQEFSIFVSLALIKPALKCVARYMSLALTFPQVQRKIVFTGTGLQHIHLRDLRAVSIPLPPLPEQQEIVRRVDQLFAFADRLEARVGTARKRVDALTQSILAKAFRGELVPNEAELARAEGRVYESAAQLLERIASVNHQGPAQQTRRPRKRKPRDTDPCNP